MKADRDGFIESPHHFGAKMPVESVLSALAAGENCDGTPYDEMQAASDWITTTVRPKSAEVGGPLSKFCIEVMPAPNNGTLSLKYMARVIGIDTEWGWGPTPAEAVSMLMTILKNGRTIPE